MLTNLTDSVAPWLCQNGTLGLQISQNGIKEKRHSQGAEKLDPSGLGGAREEALTMWWNSRNFWKGNAVNRYKQLVKEFRSRDSGDEVNLCSRVTFKKWDLQELNRPGHCLLNKTRY